MSFGLLFVASFQSVVHLEIKSLMEDPDGVSEPLCEPNINCFLYKGLHLKQLNNAKMEIAPTCDAMSIQNTT